MPIPGSPSSMRMCRRGSESSIEEAAHMREGLPQLRGGILAPDLAFE
jgi:hypothetical protein